MNHIINAGEIEGLASAYALTPIGSMNSVFNISPGWTAKIFFGLAIVASLARVILSEAKNLCNLLAAPNYTGPSSAAADSG